ncbi:hypothetical protein [Paenibacillus sp. NAIST15-1]|uniref:hypothetical protein n=1 Tax=Paenibacillus sp. NAIST15-1 TaxID=1605994 RepID=UPI00086B9363|nr:hypothetical protein [Paenibacillus sp. NAIST15-1]GAV11317.1 D-alanyl-D-alanine carboxypeptidase [Paenibacillus sp. NAIST15-1]
MDFKLAVKSLPEGVSYDPMEHTSIYDLIYLVQHELDLIEEEPEHYNHLSVRELNNLKINCGKFIRKYLLC